MTNLVKMVSLCQYFSQGDKKLSILAVSVF